MSYGWVIAPLFFLDETHKPGLRMEKTVPYMLSKVDVKLSNGC